MGRITWQECSNRAQSWGEIHSATGRQFERKLAQGKRLKRRQFCLSEGRNSLEEKKKKKETQTRREGGGKMAFNYPCYLSLPIITDDE